MVIRFHRSALSSVALGALVGAATVYASTGCGLLLDTAPPADSGAKDAGLDADDGSIRDAEPIDAVLPELDSGGPLYGEMEPLPACGLEPDPATIALFRMEDSSESLLIDATGQHTGSIVDPVRSVPGPRPACGQALDTRPDDVSGPTATGYGFIPPSSAFKLARGAVDFWLSFDAPPNSCAAVLSRDARFQNEPGHLTLYVNQEGRVGVRVQSASSSLGGVALFSTQAVIAGQWVHVGLNFGPEGAALYLDGERQLGEDVGSCWEVGTICTFGEPGCITSIEGNDNWWSVGAGLTEAEDGAMGPVDLEFAGSIDELRISATHRDFEGADFSY